jgi:tyrosyl-tRNA synthetase
VSVFQKGGVPEDMPELSVEEHECELYDLVCRYFGDKKSKSDVRRLFDQDAISFNEEKIDDLHKTVQIKNGDIVKVGKKEWFKVKTSSSSL